MKVYRDTSGFDKVVSTAARITNTTDKVVNEIRKVRGVREKVGGMSTAAKVGLLFGSAAALCLFPLQLSYDSETGEGEYKSLAVHVKRTQKPERPTSGRTHEVSVEMFPTVKPRVPRAAPSDLPPAQTKQAVKSVPMQVRKVQKVNACVPVKLCASKEEV